MSGDRISTFTNVSVDDLVSLCILLAVAGDAVATQYINSPMISILSEDKRLVMLLDRPYVGGWGYGETGSIPGHDKYVVDGKMSNLRNGHLMSCLYQLILPHQLQIL